jgi:hypothetical protein
MSNMVRRDFLRHIEVVRGKPRSNSDAWFGNPLPKKIRPSLFLSDVLESTKYKEICMYLSCYPCSPMVRLQTRLRDVGDWQIDSSIFVGSASLSLASLGRLVSRLSLGSFCSRAFHLGFRVRKTRFTCRGSLLSRC